MHRECYKENITNVEFKTLKKVVFKNLIEDAKEKGILDEVMAREILDDINKIQDYEVINS